MNLNRDRARELGFSEEEIQEAGRVIEKQDMFNRAVRIGGFDGK